LVLHQVLLQSAVVLALHMHTIQLLKILQAVVVAVVVVQPKTQIQIMVEHQHKLCHLARHLNMETLADLHRTLHTCLVGVVEVLVPQVVWSLEAEREVQVVQELIHMQLM
jgi:hypothetical protein